MHIYNCLSQELPHLEFTMEDGNSLYLPERCWALVAAETPSQAKYILWRYAKEDDFSVDELHRFKASIRIYRRDVDAPAGLLDGDHPVYDEYLKEQGCE